MPEFLIRDRDGMIDSPPIPVLNDGFVRLVDVMGDDMAIVNAARISYQKGTKRKRSDEQLIRYLMRNRHTSPFEMCTIKLHIRMPMDAWRQMVRHRTACLAGNTRVIFDLPSGRTDGSKFRSHPLTIEDIWKRFQPTRNEQPSKQRNPYHKRDRVRGMLLRQMNEETEEIQHTHVTDVFKNGKKHVFKMTLSDGKEIKCTSRHLFLFYGEGWSTLKEKFDLRLVNGKAVYDEDIIEFIYVNGKSRIVSQAWIEANQQARAGEASNFWKDGRSSTGRVGISVWGKRLKPELFENSGRKCALCKKKKESVSELDIHHIVPVWADEELGKSEDNIVLLCHKCHLKVTGKEFDYYEHFTGETLPDKYEGMCKPGSNKIDFGDFACIKKIEYVGYKMTYDLEVEGPFHNFVANGIITHNSINEYSTRYSEAIDSTQVTKPEEWRLQSGTNKQGSDGFIDVEKGEWLSMRERDLQWQSRQVYEARLARGVAREQARKDLPLSTYTEAFWQINLHNLLHFLRLRLDSHAQLEIRQYAIAIKRIVAEWVPWTWKAFEDYQLHSLTLSVQELQLLRYILGPAGITNTLKQELEVLGFARSEEKDVITKLARILTPQTMKWVRENFDE